MTSEVDVRAGSANVVNAKVYPGDHFVSIVEPSKFVDNRLFRKVAGDMRIQDVNVWVLWSYLHVK